MHKNILFLFATLALSLTACSSTMPLAQLDDSAILGEAVEETKRIAGEIVGEATAAVRSELIAENARLEAQLNESIRRVKATALDQIKKAPAKVIEKVIEPATIVEPYDDRPLKAEIAKTNNRVDQYYRVAREAQAYAAEVQEEQRQRLNAPPPETSPLDEPAVEGGLGAFLVLLIAWIARAAKTRIIKEFN